MSQLTYDEDGVMRFLVEAWNQFVKLPELHPADKQEFQAAIHCAENIILARPTIRNQADAHAAAH